MKKIALSLGMALTASLMTATSANAAGFTVTASQGGCGDPGCTSKVPGAQTIDFNSGVAPTTGFAQYSFTPGTHIYQGSTSSVSATPFQDTTKYLTLSTNGGYANQATINFSGLTSYFGLYWGSIDNYNYIDLYRGGTKLQTIGGADVTSQFASWTNVNSNLYVNIFANSAAYNFDKVVLRSTGIAFETDNHAYLAARPVPLPGMAVGAVVAGLGLLARKRQQKSASA